MFKVEYKEKIYTVYDVKIDGFDYSYYNGESQRCPQNTWFLISIDGYFCWVKSSDCKGDE